MALLNISLATVGLLLQLLHLLVSNLPMKLIASVATLILCSLLVASYFHRRELTQQGGSQYDERDKSIHKTAALTGYITAFLVFFLATLIAFLTVGPGGSIAIGRLLTAFLLVALSLFFAESISILIQYGWEAKEKNDE
jgi:hypothetical protein